MSKATSLEDVLTRGVDKLIVADELESRLRSRRRLRVKFGIDPTGDKIHLGHAVVYWKLRALQELGHEVVILIGDYTAVIGDNSDKESERQQITSDEVKQNMRHYLKQIGSIVDLERAEIRYNSEWLKKLSFMDILELASQFKVAQMLERDNFRERFAAEKPIGLQEFLYPIMQGYDSVALHADLELGGSEQLFNMMAGRVLQKRAGQKPQSVMTLELLIGTDGRKMSKSSANCIFITDTPLNMYGKVMSITDELIPQYYRLATDVAVEVIAAVEADMAGGANPRDTKASLARLIVARYYGDKASQEAEAAWNNQFRGHQIPTDIDVYQAVEKELADPIGLLANAFGVTKSEIRRLIEQGGLRVEGEVIGPEDTIRLADNSIAQLGKRRFVHIKV